MNSEKQLKRYRENADHALNMLNYSLSLCLVYVDENFKAYDDDYKLDLALRLHEHILKIVEVGA